MRSPRSTGCRAPIQGVIEVVTPNRGPIRGPSERTIETIEERCHRDADEGPEEHPASCGTKGSGGEKHRRHQAEAGRLIHVSVEGSVSRGLAPCQRMRSPTSSGAVPSPWDSRGLLSGLNMAAVVSDIQSILDGCGAHPDRTIRSRSLARSVVVEDVVSSSRTRGWFASIMVPPSSSHSTLARTFEGGYWRASEPISQHHGVTPKDDDRGILIDDEMSEMPLHAEIRACQSTLQSNRVHGTGAVRFRWVHAIMLGSQLQKRPGHDAMSHEFNGECVVYPFQATR